MTEQTQPNEERIQTIYKVVGSAINGYLAVADQPVSWAEIAIALGRHGTYAAAKNDLAFDNPADLRKLYLDFVAAQYDLHVSNLREDGAAQVGSDMVH